MKGFMFKKGRVGNGLFAHSFFKSFIVFVVMMIMTMSSASAEVINGLCYDLNSDTKTAALLHWTNEQYSGDIIVPEKVKGNDGVEYIVTTFADNCFAYCSGMTSITIPSSVKSLGDYCFWDCSSLTSITIPSSVTSLGVFCFGSCWSLTSINIPSSVTSLSAKCFVSCLSLTSINIPSSVTSLGDKCFNGCSSLTSINIPSSVKSLGNECFVGCRNLTSITIPSSVTSIGGSCFSDCSGLTSITIPSSVTSLGAGCFSGCSGLTSITIPSSVTSIGGSCFSGCSSLTSITIPSSVTSLGFGCFSGCRGLTSITIPSSVTYMGSDCFSGCSGLTSITIPSSVTELNDGCLKNCSGLTSIIIPSSVTSLYECFSGCKALQTVYFKGNVPRMYGLRGTGIPYTCIIKVPIEYHQDYKKAFGSNYQYIYPWNLIEPGNKPVTPCATPSVSYESGKLKFACETAGAIYHYTINDKNMVTDAFSEDGKVSLSAAYHISVYATADGYTQSQKVLATLYWVNANIETKINPTKTRGIVTSAHDGIVSISGLDNGEVVKFYAADGKLLGTSSAVGGVASCAVSEKMVIAKIGMDTIKVLMK